MKSRVSKKARKASTAFGKLLVAIIEQPRVKSFLSTTLNILLLIGLIGLAAWAICVSLFFVSGKGELVTFWWNLNRDNLIFSIPLGGLAIFAAWFIGSILNSVEPMEEKKA